MPAILLEISLQPGDVFDGTTFVPAQNFTYSLIGTNHYGAVVTAAGTDSGVFDFRAMLGQLEPLFDNVIDKDAARAANGERVTDLAVERGLILAAGGSVAGTDVGVHSPPNPSSATGIRDQETPNVYATLGSVDLFRFGGTQFVSTAAAGVRGGVVIVPTGYRFYIVSDGDSNPPIAQVWLIPIYDCCCWAQLASTNEQGPVP